ncbi:biliverdin-producing heme oxygenase [Cytophagaceae bacterium ABcell3]|nr:biliverdin-producing heme oxygenase [Cytophagaceae bacterium ABcell3]
MILERLKKETAENHRLVEESGLMSPVTSDDFTQEQYVHILKKFYGYFNPLEKQVESHHAILDKYLPDLSQRRKTDLILKDLETLSTPENPILCEKLPPVENLNQAFGCLYVMEGSTLGGTVISKNINKTLGLTNERGCSFFHGYGSQTGSKWKAFREALTSYCDNGGNEDEIVNSANETFNKFRDWITL